MTDFRMAEYPRSVSAPVLKVVMIRFVVGGDNGDIRRTIKDGL